MSSLMTPDSLLPVEYDAMDKNEKIKPEDCSRRVLTKKYSSIVDLQKDNHTDVYYDKEYDKTPYSILQKYSDDQKKMLPDKFVGFLAENLVQKHDCPRNKSVELAKVLIAGKKPVGEGEYAILEIRDDKETESDEEKESESPVGSAKKYYYRKSNQWIYDNSLDNDENMFIDTKEMFCNMERDCLIQKDECQPVDHLKETARKSVMKEFDRRYESTTQDFKQQLETSIVKHIKYLHRVLGLQEVKSEKVNNYCYALGTLLTESSGKEDAIQSPHQGLLETILAQQNFVKLMMMHTP